MALSADTAGSPKHRRWPVWIGGLAVLIAIGALVVARRRPAEKPLNVLLVTLDTARADRLGCYGDAQAQTPCLDQFARQGVLLERAYATAPLTLPSHASLFTGLYPPEHGIRTNGRGKFDAPVATLTDLLARAGYDTAAFVGSFVLDSKFGLDRGFAVYDDAIDATGPTDDVLHRERNGAAVVKSAIDWLSQPRTRPFYCWVHLYDPHFPYLAHEREFGRQFQDQPYAAELAYVDLQLARLQKQLIQSGQEANTLIVIVGDHGEGLGEHVEQRHGYTLYNATQRVPLVLQCPGRIVAGHRHPQPVSLVDVLPTLCDLLGQPKPTGISGRSFVAALQGKPVESVACYAATDDPLLLEGWSPLRSLTTDRWKYIRTTKPELYDLHADPGETQNLVETESQRAGEMERLLAEMERRMTVRTSASVPLSERERKTLESLGYLGGGQGAKSGKNISPGTLLDVKDMLPFFVAALAAHELAHLGQFDEAIARLREVVRQAPQQVAARYFLGQALELKGELSDAVMSYEQALDIKPDHIDALVRLGTIQGKLGQLDRAIGAFDEALQINPDSVQAHANLGRALLYQEKYDEAAKHLEEALRGDPTLPEIRVRLGEALRQAGRGPEAIPYLEEELRRTPRSIPARLNLAIILSEREPDRAAKLLMDALQLQPGNPHIHFQYGQFLLAQGRLVEASRSLQETLRLMPKHPQAEQLLQQLRQRLKQEG